TVFTESIRQYAPRRTGPDNHKVCFNTHGGRPQFIV
ncbi:MAG: hypothetical protein ACI8W7_003645, partial [Gammaproteobacteria bacterium]